VIFNNSGHNMNHETGSPKAPPGQGGIELQFLSPDQRPGLPGDLLASLVEPEIEDDTEAAEALRANASIKVGKLGKVARSVNAQTVRKLAKKATLRGHGNKRGKPPRIPPGLAAAGENQQYLDDANQIYAVQEVDDESEYLSHDSDEDDNASEISGSVQNSLERGRVEHDALAGAAVTQVPLKAGDGRVAKKEGSERAHHLHAHDDGSAVGPSKDHTVKRGKGVHPIDGGDEAEDIPTEVVAATMDAGKKLMGALDPHHMLQFQRWRRKKKGKKQRKSYVKGKVIDGRHELYTLSIAVMLGVRTSIARTNTVISASDGPGKKMLSPQDFMAEEKYEFAPKVRFTSSERCIAL
jgi:1-phosphatidylinositol-4-phosphate 5-kinase